MNERVKAVRATLEQARASISRTHTTAAIERLTNALDVLTGEVERHDAWLHRVADALVALRDAIGTLGKWIKAAT